MPAGGWPYFVKRTQMVAHLKLVDIAYLPTPRRARVPTPKHPPGKFSRKLTLADVTIAIIAGVIAAWISD